MNLKAGSPVGPVTARESGQGLEGEAQAPGSLATIPRRHRPGGGSGQWRYVTGPDRRPNSSCESGQFPRCF